MSVYDTPWGPRIHTKEDEERDRILFEIQADHDRALADVGYYCADLIEKYEGTGSLNTMGLVEWLTSESQAEQKRVFKLIRDVIKADKESIKEYGRLAVEIEEKCMKLKQVKLDDKLAAKEFYTHLHVDIPVEKLQERIKKNEQILALCKPIQEGEESPLLDFERAKLTPIDTIIEFRRGFAPCIWHDERTPSMKYYKKNNKVHCFGCGKSGDVIDVIQQIKGCDIKEAVSYLTP